MVSQNNIQIPQALIRLTQVYARAHQLSFPKRVARLIAQEAIFALDPLLDFCLDESSALSEIDALARVMQVNDIVLNGRHIDVAIVDLKDHLVMVPGVLAQSNYCRNGSLIVSMSDATSGAVVGYIEPQIWLELVQSFKTSTKHFMDLEYLFKIDPGFELEICLSSILSKSQSVDEPFSKVENTVLQAADYIHFLREPASISVSKQIKILNNCLADPSVRENMTALSEFQSDNLPAILSQSSAWEARLSNLASRMQVQYPDWQLAQLIDLLRSTGNKYGGQPESSAFKLHVVRTLLAGKQSKDLCAKVQSLAESILEQLFAGKKVVSNVRDYVKNQVAVDIAAQIQTTRQGLLNFSQATSDEISMAVSQLSLQPAYATHSLSETSSIDDINEALQFLAIVKTGDELDHILSGN